MLRVILCSILLPTASIAQSPNEQSEPPRFEVAVIHPTNPSDLLGPSGCFDSGAAGLMRCTNVTLKRCIVGAYAVLPDQVMGGPDWIDVDRFQITGKAGKPLGEKGLMAMLQTLLAERFKLVLHRKLRPAQTMVLEVAKRGAKLQPAGDALYSWQNMHDHLEATKLTMGEFAEILSRNLNLPVIDRTGLTGAFNLTLRWNPDVTDGLSHAESAVALLPEVAAAISRQLGLTLKIRKMPVEMFVIDHAEKPTESDN
jgi:uncharacterized protein (TIGR03435 family)